MKVYTFSMSFILLLIIFSMAIPAQEIIGEMKLGKPASESEAIISSDGDVISVDKENAPRGRMQVEVYEGDTNNRAEQERMRRSRQAGELPPEFLKMTQEGKVPPEVIEMMKSGEITIEDLKDPEKRKDVQKKVELMRRESKSESSPIDKPSENPEQEAKENEKAGKGSPDDGLKRYMDAVVNKNLFLPLGSGGEDRKSSFAVTALMSSNTDSRRPEDKAIIQEIGSNKGYYVSEGDSFADNVKVLEIDDNEVKLDRSGEEMTIKLGEGTGGGGGRGGWSGGGGRPSGNQPGGNRPEMSKRQEAAPNPGGGNFDPSQIPPFALEILKQRGISIEELQNNPDLREKLRAEFTQRFGGGGGRPAMRQGGRDRGQRDR